MSHLDYLTWIAWLDLQVYSPDRHDLYIMALIREVRYLLSKQQPPELTPDNLIAGFGIIFNDAAPAESDELDVDAISAASKARWTTALRMNKNDRA